MWRKWCRSDSLRHGDGRRMSPAFVSGGDVSSVMEFYASLSSSQFWDNLQYFFFFYILIFPIRGTEAGSWIVYRSKEAACSDTRQSVSGNMSDQASAASRLTKACQEENIASFLQAELSVQFLKIWASNIERVKPDLAHRGCKSQLLGSNLQTPCSRGGISSAFVISSQLGKALLLHGR